MYPHGLSAQWLFLPTLKFVWLDRSSQRPELLAGWVLNVALLCPRVSGLLQITFLAQL